jgi:hypothetical protein
MPNGNPFLFNEDKSIIKLEDTSVLLWEGDGMPTSGNIMFYFSEIPIYEYRYVYLLTVDDAGDFDGNILIPSSENYNGSITKNDTIRSVLNNYSTATSDTYVRKITNSSPAMIEDGYIGISDCIRRHEIWVSNGDTVLGFDAANNQLIPYQLWGIM